MSEQSSKPVVSEPVAPKPAAPQSVQLAPQEPVKPGQVQPQLANQITEAITHLERIKQDVLTHAGKPGVNPYAYTTAKIDPLINRLRTGKRVVTDSNNMPQMVPLSQAEANADIVTALALTNAPENYAAVPPGLAYATESQKAATGATTPNVELGTVGKAPVKPVQK